MNESNSNKYYGKYRGTVISNLDPMKLGRLQLSVPDVLSQIPSTWAEPCVPLAGPTGKAMGFYLVPPVGAGVWVEFERGDPDYPIWVGCRWGGESDIPSAANEGLPASPNIVLQTLGEYSLVISDQPGQTGGITLKSPGGASIIVNDTGIYIKNGKDASITLVGSAVDINDGAIKVV